MNVKLIFVLSLGIMTHNYWNPRVAKMVLCTRIPLDLIV